MEFKWTDPNEHWGLTTLLFVRGLGLVFLNAFLSLTVQVQGLMGESGVAPAQEFVAFVGREPHLTFWDFPSLFHFGSSDAALLSGCAIGCFASFALLMGLVPRWMLALCWLLYLSFVNVGFPFMAFQWDLLLIEVALIGVLLAPGSLIARFDGATSPHPWARYALYWLLFRLMFRSGWVKVASGDFHWRELSALTVHYETQPLPTLFGWYAHQLPDGIHTLFCLLMFAIELVVPFLIFVPRLWARRVVAGSFAGLMLGIALTGNYTFFNFLTALMCLPLLSERAFLGRWAPSREPNPPDRPKPRRRKGVQVVAALVVVLSTYVFLSGSFRLPQVPLSGFRTFNNYGLFAVMTRRRPEITIEGSNDGVNWAAYRLPYKPGALDAAPKWCAPYQPRLDWQMWFAALGSSRDSRWVQSLFQRMLAGEPHVLALFEHNPFPEQPPRFIRATIRQYHFTTTEERSETGDYWTATEPMIWAGPVRRPD